MSNKVRRYLTEGGEEMIDGMLGNLASSELEFITLSSSQSSEGGVIEDAWTTYEAVCNSQSKDRSMDTAEEYNELIPIDEQLRFYEPSREIYDDLESSN